MKMLPQLNQPYPSPGFRGSVYRDVFFAVSLSVFLLVFKPFGLDVYHLDRVHFIIGYGVIALVTTVFNDVLAFTLFPVAFREAGWTLGKQISWLTWQLLVFGSACFVYAVYIDAFPFSVAGFLKVQLYVVLCAILPIGVYTLLRQNYMLRRNEQEAVRIDTTIHSVRNDVINGEQVSQPGLLRLFGDNRNEELVLRPDNFFYAAAQDNYVQVTFSTDNGMRRQLLRNTLSSIEEQLGKRPSFFRCHRSFIANLDKVTGVTGNAQGYFLSLQSLGEQVPVARSRGKELQSMLQRKAVI